MLHTTQIRLTRTGVSCRWEDLLLDKSQVLDNAQRLEHERVGLPNRTTAAAPSPTKQEPSPFAAVLTTEHIRHVLSVLTRFTVKRTHENGDDDNDTRTGEKKTRKIRHSYRCRRCTNVRQSCGQFPRTLPLIFRDQNDISSDQTWLTPPSLERTRIKCAIKRRRETESALARMCACAMYNIILYTSTTIKKKNYILLKAENDMWRVREYIWFTL